MAFKKYPSQVELHKLFEYNKELGILFYKNSLDKAGNSAKYSKIMIKGIKYYTHIIIWIYMTGEYPIKTIDHIDRNPRNNKWNNLRLATQKEQLGNIKLNVKNKSGYRGVSWFKKIKNGERKFILIIKLCILDYMKIKKMRL